MREVKIMSRPFFSLGGLCPMYGTLIQTVRPLFAFNHAFLGHRGRGGHGWCGAGRAVTFAPVSDGG